LGSEVTLALREYQQQALDAEARHRIEHLDETRLAIVMATGLGKTIVMAERARRYITSFEGAGNRVVLLVHTDELAQQAEAKVRLVVSSDEYPITVGVVKAERDETDADIIIASVQTLANPVRRQRITDVGLVLVDECHHATAASYQAILRHFGCFATPPPHPMDSFPTFVNRGPITPALGFTRHPGARRPHLPGWRVAERGVHPGHLLGGPARLSGAAGGVPAGD
jgi:hypothetical protein